MDSSYKSANNLYNYSNILDVSYRHINNKKMLPIKSLRKQAMEVFENEKLIWIKTVKLYKIIYDNEVNQKEI